ncbi:MAG: hypothetical protein GTN89_00715 [Acidobacteria bacterium]|nr:hypothetical protein [Acidobacteriota bacterium]NIM60629.1 hypothetical protein [Acidobacteriota bacterium]NIO57916.1 hypothetical protein [Acidobacteriota bacterium]NIQ28919.1 hypothetical protein [Acidobacteriota bacterium]NIQ83393.1 hypothetical protein [Acidobacteriota bacterium]
MRHLPYVRISLLLALAAGVATGSVTVSVEPETVTIGDPLTLRVAIEGVQSNPPLREKLGPQLGPFTVLEEQWTEQAGDEDRRVWVWSATLAVYETGEQLFPGLTLAASSADAPGWKVDGFSIDVRSVLDDAETESGEIDIADLKGPASLAPNLLPVWLAAMVLVVLLAVASLLWWLNRRYASRLAAVPAIEDPFARIAPHEWAFAQLRKLLDEQSTGSVDSFYERLAWILKRYLGGRYRADLLELTTDEVRPVLEQAGTPSTALARITPLLGDCDAVKFAKYEPSDAERKEIVERVYGIVDQTKPVERPADTDDRAGAA